MAEKNKNADQDSDDDELSENEQKNLENILVLFPFREKKTFNQTVDDATFERIKEALRCNICYEIYKDPVYIKDCMHRFCNQCIQKIIRTNQQSRSCPFCRTPLGTKRVLREDEVTKMIIDRIFPDLTEYLNMEDKQAELYYSNRIKEVQNINKTGRKKNKQSDLLSPNTLTGSKRILVPTGERKDKRKLNAAKTVEVIEEPGEKPQKKVKKSKTVQEVTVIDDVPEAKDDIKEENNAKTSEVKEEECKEIETIKEEPKEGEGQENSKEKLFGDTNIDEEMIKSLKDLMERTDLKEIIMSLDFLTPVIIEPLPSESYLKHLENPVVKTTSAIKVEQLSKYICKKLNLNELKYNERIQVWIKNDSKFEIVDRQMTLKDIGNKYWTHLQKIDWEVYDLIAHVKEYLDKTTKPMQIERVLYYSVYLDDWL